MSFRDLKQLERRYSGTAGELVIVDEAHAARQQVFRQGMPNQLLSLLQEIQARRKNGLYWLLTATPMQLDPHEVHDLLKLCGLDDPAWKDWQMLSGFQRFFQRLQVFESDRSVREPVVEMTRVAVSRGAADLDPSRPPNQTWKPFEWRTLVGQLRSRTGLLLSLQKMTVDQAQALVPHLARQTPLAVHMFRHTRATLRAYQERGLVRGLAHRVAEDLPVSFQTDEERELYKRIDEAPSQRKGERVCPISRVSAMAARSVGDPSDVLTTSAQSVGDPSDASKMVARSACDPSDVLTTSAQSAGHPADISETAARSVGDPSDVVTIFARSADRPNDRSSIEITSCPCPTWVDSALSHFSLCHRLMIWRTGRSPISFPG